MRGLPHGRPLTASSWRWTVNNEQVMIEHLQGTLLEKTPTKAVISAAGVGYGALISLATFEALPDIGQQAAIHTYLAVREDALTLFGFATTAERDGFLLLTSVTGVGAKIALNILSSAGLDHLRENISHGNAVALTRLPGVGRKLADRIILELREKIDRVDSGPSLDVGDARIFGIREEALTALTVLGYNRAAAEKGIRTALKQGPHVEESVESLIKAALGSLTS